jgi:hypothetical protein
MSSTSDPKTRRHVVPHAAVRVDLPADWAIDPSATIEDSGIELVALAPDGTTEGGFRPNAVVTSSRIGSLALPDWEDGTDEVLDRTMAGYLLLDRFRRVDGAGEVSRRLATYRTDAGTDVTTAQWSRARDGLGVTATVTVATEDYPAWRDRLDAIGNSFSWEDRI